MLIVSSVCIHQLSRASDTHNLSLHNIKTAKQPSHI